MHQCARSGWLHEAVHTSCLHTNQHWCLLSALILVNTDVFVRKRSDRCMIEVLKSRHSSLFRSPRVAVILLMHFYPDIICISSLSSPATFFGGWGGGGDLFNWCNAPFASFSVNCKIVFQQIVIITSLSFIEAEFSASSLKRTVSLLRDLGRTCLILSGGRWLHMDFATFSKTLLYEQVRLNEICKR